MNYKYKCSMRAIGCVLCICCIGETIVHSLECSFHRKKEMNNLSSREQSDIMRCLEESHS